MKARQIEDLSELNDKRLWQLFHMKHNKSLEIFAFLVSKNSFRVVV